jgi:DNA-binding transcriptional ArsR family regulator
MNLSKIPPELKARPQWVVWQVETPEGKETKVPYQPRNPERKASTTNPDTWAPLEQALSVVKINGFAGIGYVFSPQDDYAGVDLDKCRDPITEKIEPWAMANIDRLASYTEISPSGHGLHILVKGKVPPGGNKKGKVEMYSQGRYFTMTGAHLEETPTTIEARQTELEALHTEIFGKPSEPKQLSPKAPGPALDLTDFALIDKAIQRDPVFARLWQGDTSGQATPSEADYALVGKLAWWTNKDPERIDRLFRQSGLCQDPGRLKKWDRLATSTINKAIANTEGGYCPRSYQAPPAAPESPQAGKPQAPTLKPISAKDLGAKIFSPPRWAVPELFPEGLIILAGKPKAGKSWLALNVAVSVASGGVALGKIQVEAGEALYLALEDSERRLKERLEKIVPFGDLPATLHFLTARDFPPLQKGGLEALDNWLADHPPARLVVIDTLGRVKPTRGKNADAYDHDTAVISTLQTLAIKHRLALICVHHTKKLATDDFVESVSGTFGLTGAADAIAVLIRKDRTAADAVLKITGRDVADIEKAMKFHPDLGTWEILGEAQEFASSQERQDILLILREVGPKTPAQLAKIIDKSRDSVKMILSRMKASGLVKANSKGEYETISL